MTNSTISQKQRDEILKLLQARFEKNMNRHKGLAWASVRASAPNKVLRADEAYATTGKRWIPGKNTSQKIAP